MSAIMNETQLWFCDICDKTINIEKESKYFSSKTNKNTKKKKVPLLTKLKLINQKLMKRNIYSMILLKIVVKTISVLLNIDVYMILKLQIWKRLKEVVLTNIHEIQISICMT